MSSKSLQRQAARATAPIKCSDTAASRFGLLNKELGLGYLIPQSLLETAVQVPDNILRLDEDELFKQFTPTKQDRRMKIAFWQEYERAATRIENMDIERAILHTGIPCWPMYEGALRENPYLLSWLLLPPASYKLQIDETLSLCLERLREIVQLPLFDTKGRVNASVAKMILEAYKLLDMRKHGSYTQRNVNVNVDAGKAPENSTLDMNAIDAKLAELEAELGSSVAKILDVQAT